MAYKVLNRVKMTVASAPGVGAITLGSAVAGFQAFSAAAGSITTSDTVHYVLEDGTNWELGLGTYNSTGPVLTRTTVIESSNAGSAINATSSAVVYVTIHASDITAIPVANLTGTLPVASGGTGLTSGTSGGVLYYSASGTLASSGALTANALVIGGGAGVSPSTTTTGTGVLTALGNPVNATGGFITYTTYAPASGKTLTVSNSITLAGTDGTTMTFPSASSSIGYLNIPQVTKSAAYTPTDTSDVGKHISISTGGVTVNASIYSAGDVFTIYNNSTSSQTITNGTNVTFYLAGTATTGPRTLAQRGVATLLCVVGGATPTFVVSGAGVT